MVCQRTEFKLHHIMYQTHNPLSHIFTFIIDGGEWTFTLNYSLFSAKLHRYRDRNMKYECS